MDTSASRQRGNPPGPTAAAVARNIGRVRFAREMTQQALSDRLTQLGRPIPTSSIGKIEAGLRTVDVDDLMALALALEVSPLGLLLPRTSSRTDDIEVTGTHGPAENVWKWATGYASQDPSRAPATDGTALQETDFTDMSIPRWLGLDFTEVSLPRWLDVGVIVRELPAGEVPRWHAGELREFIEGPGGDSDG